MVPAKQAHPNNSKLACMKQENRFYPLPCFCSVHFACHYPASMYQASEPITAGSGRITILSNSIFSIKSFVAKVFQSGLWQWPRILKSHFEVASVVYIYVCLCVCVAVCPCTAWIQMAHYGYRKHWMTALAVPAAQKPTEQHLLVHRLT